MNPILPAHICIPDVEAHQWGNSKTYLYGSKDIEGDTTYCSPFQHVFSSVDLLNWVDHGLAFDVKKSHMLEGNHLYAPDCFFKNEKYYLTYCGSDNSEGIAMSDRPEGPFSEGWPVEGADKDAIDPSALCDDDGSVYYFWGQGTLRGAKLSDDLKSIDTSTFKPALLNEAEHGFHEGPSIRKHNGIYYMVYCDSSRGKATSLAYATSEHPLGPYLKRGIIIDNAGCDPSNWNNHGSIEKINEKWYIFYHRASHDSKFNRRVCIEPIQMNEDGTIDEVEMTTQGVSGPILANQPVEAYRACKLSGKLYSASSAEDDNCGNILTHAVSKDCATYKYLSFSKTISQFHCRVTTPKTGGVMEVRLDDSEGVLLATCEIPSTGSWHSWQEIQANLNEPIEGEHAVCLIIRGAKGRVADISKFWFS